MSRRGGRKSSNHKEAIADDSAVSASEDESSAHDHDHQPGQKKSEAKRRSKAFNKDSPKPTKKKEEDTEKKKDHEEGPNNKKEEEENSKQQAHNLKRVGALLKKPKLVPSKWHHHHKGKKGKEEAASTVEHRIPSPREERKECEHGMDCQEIDPQHFINFAHTPNAHRTKAEAENGGDPLAQKREEKEEEKQEEEAKTTATTKVDEEEQEAKEMEENVVDKEKEEDKNEEQQEEEEKTEKENEEEEAKQKADEEKERNGILAKEEKLESSNEEEDKNNEEGEKGAAASSEEAASSSESADGNKSEKEGELVGTPMNYAHHRLTKTSFKSLGSQFRRNTVTSLIDPSPLPPSMRKMTIQEQKADYRKSMGPFAMRNYKEDGSVRTFADVVSPDVLATISVAERKRQDVIFELITTEQQYVQDLHILVDVFLKPVRQRQFLNKMEQAMIFSNVEALLDVNSALLEDLFRRQKENIVVERVGDILVERSDLFKLYAVYCSNQPIIMTELTKLKTKYPPFKEFLDEAFRNPQCRLLELHSFLIHPLQRICKYPLLLKELLKNTPEDHPDHMDLKEALERISEVVDLINERTRQVKNVADVTEIENSIQGGEALNLAQRDRSVVRQAEVKYWDLNARSKLKDKCVNLVVLNDTLLILNKAKEVPAGTPPFKLCDRLDLQELVVRLVDPVRDLSTKLNIKKAQELGQRSDAFFSISALVSQKKKGVAAFHLFEAKTKKEAESWVRTMESSIRQLATQRALSSGSKQPAVSSFSKRHQGQSSSSSSSSGGSLQPSQSMGSFEEFNGKLKSNDDDSDDAKKKEDTPNNNTNGNNTSGQTSASMSELPALESDSDEASETPERKSFSASGKFNLKKFASSQFSKMERKSSQLFAAASDSTHLHLKHKKSNSQLNLKDKLNDNNRVPELNVKEVSNGVAPRTPTRHRRSIGVISSPRNQTSSSSDASSLVIAGDLSLFSSNNEGDFRDMVMSRQRLTELEEENENLRTRVRELEAQLLRESACSACMEARTHTSNNFEVQEEKKNKTEPQQQLRQSKSEIADQLEKGGMNATNGKKGDSLVKGRSSSAT
ncbi:Rho guanine nucleotide exchange factor (GEF) 17 [Balamuthia mandrillaris]